MTAVLTTARTTVATALQGNVTGNVFSGPVKAPVPPCVVIEPDSPWVEWETLPTQVVHLTARVTVRADTTNLTQLEDLLEEVLSALPSDVTWTQISNPVDYDLGAQGYVTACTIALDVHLKYVKALPS